MVRPARAHRRRLVGNLAQIAHLTDPESFAEGVMSFLRD